MKLNGTKWLAAGAAMVAVAGCEQGNDPVGVNDAALAPAFAVTVPAIPNESLTVCKEGPAGKSYSFQLTNFTNTAVKTAEVDANNQFTLAADQCKKVATGEGTVQVEEINQPAGTMFDQVANYVWFPANGTTTQIPVLDGRFSPNPSQVNLTSSRNFGNDFGRLLLYRDSATPSTGCTLTQGYWKTHNVSFKGGAEPDPTWNTLSSAELTTFFLSGQSWFGVFWTPVGGNAYYNLAHQYMAAVLNYAAGAPTIVTSTINTATTLFNTYTPAQIAALSGNNSLRKQFIALAGTLGAYNEGTLSGADHCN